MRSFIPTGPKHDYCYHTEAMDRAQLGGIDDVGCGVLFGLELYRYEFAGLLMHAEHLEAVFGVGPHTISVPRIRRADDIDPDSFDNGIDDDTFAKLVACIPHRSSLHRHDCIHQRKPENQGTGAAPGYFPNQRRFQDKRGRLF